MAEQNKTPAAPKAADTATKVDHEVVTNFEVVDNTSAPVAVEAPVEAEEVELLDGFVQVNYK